MPLHDVQHSALRNLLYRKLIHFGLVLRRIMKEDADTRTTIIVTNLPGSALSIYLCCTSCGARPRADVNVEMSHL